jgi:hypothetical protein
MKRAIREVRAEFKQLLDDANKYGYDRRFPCFNKPEIYQDYTHSPSPEQAEEMCVGCPIFAECREFGEVTKPGGGVWGGIAYRYGIPLRRSTPKAA